MVITHGPIALLFEGEDRLKLTNWRHATLLNSTFKDFAKALQRRFQPLLVEVIDSDQTAFFPCKIHSRRYSTHA